MSYAGKLTAGYAGFFKKMGLFSHLPISGTFNQIHKCFVPHAMSAGAEIMGGLYAAGVTCILLPVLLPLAAVTSSIALVLAAAAVLTTPFTYSVAAVMDCVESREPAARPLL